jgi:predicted AAA+ superfamily ATPase
VQTYLKEEVLQEGLTRNLSALSRFLEVASFSQGSILNSSVIAREVGLDNKTISNYFALLEDLLLSNGVEIDFIAYGPKGLLARVTTSTKANLLLNSISRTKSNSRRFRRIRQPPCC